MNASSQLMIDGTELKIPIYSSLATAFDHWSDGRSELSDGVSVFDVGLDILDTVVDPLHAIISAPVGWLLDFIVEHVSFLKDTLDLLAGNSRAIMAQAQVWENLSRRMAGAGVAHEGMITGTSCWSGPAFSAFQRTQTATHHLFESALASAVCMENWIKGVGLVVSIVREFVWGQVKEFVVQIVQAAILALAAAVPSGGASIAGFGSWFVGKLVITAGRVTRAFEKLFRQISELAKSLGLSGEWFDKVASTLSKAAAHLSHSGAGKIHATGILADPHLPSLRPALLGKEGSRSTKTYDAFMDVSHAAIEGIQKAMDPPSPPSEM